MTLADICKPTPVYATATQRLIPSFGRNSKARSVWIPIGLGGFDASASATPFFKQVSFLFGDIDPSTGQVLTTAEFVHRQAPILGPDPLVNPQQGFPYISPTEPRKLVMDASSLIGTPGEVFLDNLGLTEHFVLELAQVGAPEVFRRHDVAAAQYDAGTGALTLTTSLGDPPLATFTPPGGPTAALVPSFFSIRTQGTLDRLPDSARVCIRFQAAPMSPSGVPDLTAIVPGPTVKEWTSDHGLLNASSQNRDLRFLRFEVLFDIDAKSSGLSPASPRPMLEFLRFPFRY